MDKLVSILYKYIHKFVYFQNKKKIKIKTWTDSFWLLYTDQKTQLQPTAQLFFSLLKILQMRVIWLIFPFSSVTSLFIRIICLAYSSTDLKGKKAPCHIILCKVFPNNCEKRKTTDNFPFSFNFSIIFI